MVYHETIRYQSSPTIDNYVRTSTERNGMPLVVGLTLGLVGLADGLARGISQAQGFGYPENSSLIAGILEISQALNMAVYMNTTTPQPGTTIREPRRLFLSGYGYLVGLGIEGLAIALGQGIGYYM